MALPDINKFGPPFNPLIKSPFNDSLNNGGSAPIVGNFFLFENGNFFQLESGGKLLLEA
jgi:hypothetical protein